MTESYEKWAIKLRASEWRRLEQLAEETNSRPLLGVNARRISVAELIRRIAKGEFRLVETYTNPVELTPEMEAEWERQRDEWQRRRQSHDIAETPTAGPYTQLKMMELEAA